MTRIDLADEFQRTRKRTLELLAPYSSQELETTYSTIMSPLVWDLAHIAAYEDYWIAHKLGGTEPLHQELMSTYNATDTPRDRRGSIKLLTHSQSLLYLNDVRERTLSFIDQGRFDNRLFFDLVLSHERQHTETMLQAIELAHLATPPGLPALQGAFQADYLDAGYKSRVSSRCQRPTKEYFGLERVYVPAGPCRIGAPPNRFSYDNERPIHTMVLNDFFIGIAPVTNCIFLDFVETGGYQRKEWWSPDGWKWNQMVCATHPGGWQLSDRSWLEWHLDGWHELDPIQPVTHISWYEAQAFATAHGARLPSEFEWEKAVAWDETFHRPLRYPWGDNDPRPGDHYANIDQWSLSPLPPLDYESCSPYGLLSTLGNIWEWTESSFQGYKGFLSYPYYDYSEPFFGDKYKVLRGGSWATQAAVITPTFRNWDLPQRRQIFAGFRLAWDL